MKAVKVTKRKATAGNTQLYVGTLVGERLEELRQQIVPEPSKKAFSEYVLELGMAEVRRLRTLLKEAGHAGG